MPTYEYACKACGHRLEAVQKFTDDALTECPECGGALRKVFGAPGIVLKGSGFYKTDTRAADKRSSSSEKSSSNGSGAGSGSGSGSDSKSDSSASTTKDSGSGSGSGSGSKSGSDGSSSGSGSSSDKPAKETKPAASTASNS